jgi:uncharacterized protein YkwD
MHTGQTTTAAMPARVRVIALALALAFSLSSLVLATPTQATTRGDGLRAEANEKRVKRDRPRVAGRALLDDIADRRADQMRDRRELEHDMDYVRNRLVKSGVCWTAFGEIIAWSSGDYSYARTIGQWMDSDLHRHIMLDADYNAAGGSWATASDGGHYSVMIFVRLCSSELESGPSLLRPDDEYSPNRPMVFRDGKHRAFKLSSTGKVLDVKRVTLADRRREESTGRARSDGDAYLKVTTGPLAGYWVRESPRRFVRGMTDKNRFGSTRRVSLEKGTYRAFKFDDGGHVTRARTRDVKPGTVVRVLARAIINGRGFFKVAAGAWDGYWLRDTGAVDRLW